MEIRKWSSLLEITMIPKAAASSLGPASWPPDQAEWLMSSLMDPKNYDLNSTSTRKNLPQPCPPLRVRSKGLEYSRSLEAACQFVANLLSLGYFYFP